MNPFKKLSVLLALFAFIGSANAGELSDGESVKVGVLHSLSGTMAISETSLRDILLFTFDEINANGGINGNTISLSLLNDECKSDKGVANANKFAYQDNEWLGNWTLFYWANWLACGIPADS